MIKQVRRKKISLSALVSLSNPIVFGDCFCKQNRSIVNFCFNFLGSQGKLALDRNMVTLLAKACRKNGGLRQTTLSAYKFIWDLRVLILGSWYVTGYLLDTGRLNGKLASIFLV